MNLSNKIDDPRREMRLMLLVRDDDRGAFKTLYEYHNISVGRFFFGMSRDSALASDLSQETFLRIWTIRKRYRATGKFTSYLFAIANIIWLEHLRAKTKELRWTQEHTRDELATMFGADNAWLPDEAAGHSEIQARIFAALDDLPEDQRMTFVLRTVQGLSAHEVASVMQCPLNTVRSRRILAVKKLRKALGKSYSDHNLI